MGPRAIRRGRREWRGEGGRAGRGIGIGSHFKWILPHTIYTPTGQSQQIETIYLP